MSSDSKHLSCISQRRRGMRASEEEPGQTRNGWDHFSESRLFILRRDSVVFRLNRLSFRQQTQRSLRNSRAQVPVQYAKSCLAIGCEVIFKTHSTTHRPCVHSSILHASMLLRFRLLCFSQLLLVCPALQTQRKAQKIFIWPPALLLRFVACGVWTSRNRSRV